MRKIFAQITVLLVIACTVRAQCNTKTRFNAAKTEFIKQSGDTAVKEDPVVLTEDTLNVDVVIGNGRDELKGTVTNYACNFTDPDNGMISFKSEVTDKSGDVRHATFTINTKDGKTTIIVEAEEEQSKIRLSVDSSEVVNN